MAGLLIEKGFGVSYSEEAVGLLMRHRMGLTLQRPCAGRSSATRSG